MNTEISGNFGINKRLGLKSHNRIEPGHISEKKGSISYDKKRAQKRHIFFIFKQKRLHFLHFQGAQFSHATLMLIHKTPEIGSGN